MANDKTPPPGRVEEAAADPGATTPRSDADAKVLAGHREHLLALREKSYESFDKTLFTLAGGGLALSITFIDKVVGDAPIASTTALYWGWVLWIGTLSCVLASHFFSRSAVTRAISELDGRALKRGKAGGFWSSITEYLNSAGAILFIVGLILIVNFVSSNLEASSMPDENDSNPSSMESSKDLPDYEEHGVTPRSLLRLRTIGCP